jgi:hypothetical protein
MRSKLFIALLLAALAPPEGGAGAGAGTSGDGPAAFALLKTLAGSWRAPEGAGRQSTVTFELSANGTVLVEQYVNPALPGGGRMMSAYHLDGSDLLLTHYCIANNQPTLRAARFDAAARELQFEFVRATNLASAAAGHMRRAKYRLVDANTFITEWEFFEKGVRTLTEVETFIRVQ